MVIDRISIDKPYLPPYKDVIGHYHTAGNPGRAEVDDKHEINYPGVMNAIVNTGYDGYVSQEFIPHMEREGIDPQASR